MARTYEVRTFGCQMNAHDSERIAGLLEQEGYRPAATGTLGDVVIYNTCAVRENAARNLYKSLRALRDKAGPDTVIGVGGCLAQQDREEIVRRAPWVELVFGTHNMADLPAMLRDVENRRETRVEIAELLQVFPSTLPTRRSRTHSAWVAISVGCNNTCTFCIVPTLRGKEVDRRPEDVLAEVRATVAEGALEVTLLGQNVNSYGVQFGDRGAFARLLRECGTVEGLERVRFTSPHPAEFTDDVLTAMAETPNVMPVLHMPLQSGSDRILRAMRRSYRRDRYLGILDRARAALGEPAITTDIIVGFPGETDADFEDTLDLVRRAEFASAFTFQYSPRPGTPAAELPDQVPPEVVAARFRRLTDLQDSISLRLNQRLPGRTVELIVEAGGGRKDAATGRLSGRGPDNRLVHFRPPADTEVRPGDAVRVVISHAAPHHLLADGAVLDVRRTAGGDAWEQGQASVATDTATATVAGLGMPAFGRPAGVPG